MTEIVEIVGRVSAFACAVTYFCRAVFAWWEFPNSEMSFRNEALFLLWMLLAVSK